MEFVVLLGSQILLVFGQWLSSAWLADVCTPWPRQDGARGRLTTLAFPSGLSSSATVAFGGRAFYSISRSSLVKRMHLMDGHSVLGHAEIDVGSAGVMTADFANCSGVAVQCISFGILQCGCWLDLYHGGYVE